MQVLARARDFFFSKASRVVLGLAQLPSVQCGPFLQEYKWLKLEADYSIPSSVDIKNV
jgi:hypothetical protein